MMTELREKECIDVNQKETGQGEYALDKSNRKGKVPLRNVCLHKSLPLHALRVKGRDYGDVLFPLHLTDFTHGVPALG